MPSRRVVALLAALVLVAGMLVVYAVGERDCPPPSWAFWRVTAGGDGRTNFACIADG